MLIVDVRTVEEFNEGHLKGALLIPHPYIAQMIGEYVEDKEREIGLYCAAGVRSNFAMMILKEMGYKNAVNLGGYEALKRHFPYQEGEGQ